MKTVPAALPLAVVAALWTGAAFSFNLAMAPVVLAAPVFLLAVLHRPSWGLWALLLFHPVTTAYAGTVARSANFGIPFLVLGSWTLHHLWDRRGVSSLPSGMTVWFAVFLRLDPVRLVLRQVAGPRIRLGVPLPGARGRARRIREPLAQAEPGAGAVPVLPGPGTHCRVRHMAGRHLRHGRRRPRNSGKMVFHLRQPEQTRCFHGPRHRHPHRLSRRVRNPVPHPQSAAFTSPFSSSPCSAWPEGWWCRFPDLLFSMPAWG